MELGHNIMTTSGYVSAADRAQSTGADVYQIFYRSPHSYQPFERPEAETLELARKNKQYNKKMVIHGSYIINLCQDPTDYRHFKGVNILVDDLNVSVKLNAMGVIIHMGNDTEGKGNETSKQNYIKGIKEALRRSDKKSTLILETGAGTGREVSSSLEELGEIRFGLTSEERKRVKFCLDTCHMFAYGYKLHIPDAVDILDLDIEHCLGWNNVVVVHLNDSEDSCSSRKDNHADIGKGMISFNGLMRFVHLCVKHNVPMILETPTHYYNEKRFTAVDQMNLIRTYYDVMYKNMGPYVKVDTRTIKKTDLRKKIDDEQKIKVLEKKEGKKRGTITTKSSQRITVKKIIKAKKDNSDDDEEGIVNTD